MSLPTLMVDPDRLSTALPTSSDAKVLLVLGTLWGENGITSHLLTLAKGLQARGCQVALASGIASMSEDSIAEAQRAIAQFSKDGIPHFEVQFSSLKPSPQNVIAALKSVQSLDAVVAQFKPDVIHLHSLSIAPYVKWTSMRYKIPVISTSHLEPGSQQSPSWIRCQINRSLAALWGDRLIAISREIQSFFIQSLQVTPDRIQLIYHGIDDTHFRPPTEAERIQARLTYNLSESDRVICLVGRLDPIKGHDVLIQALSILKQQHFKVTVLFAGKGYGNELSRVLQQAEDHDVLEQVQCLGLVETRSVLWSSDIITLPSRREGFPLVILEGMLCGLIPIRTPAAGAFDQIQEGETGWIVPFDDPPALADRIRQTFEDESLRSKLSTQALKFAQEHFTIDRMIHQTIAVYDEILVKIP